jgi:hypothetical protein
VEGSLYHPPSGEALSLASPDKGGAKAGQRGRLTNWKQKRRNIPNHNYYSVANITKSIILEQK